MEIFHLILVWMGFKSIKFSKTVFFSILLKQIYHTKQSIHESALIFPQNVKQNQCLKVRDIVVFSN